MFYEVVDKLETRCILMTAWDYRKKANTHLYLMIIDIPSVTINKYFVIVLQHFEYCS